MKKIIIYLMLPVLLLTASCSDYFDEVNKSGITAYPFYTSEFGVNAHVNACYALQRRYWGRIWEINDMGTDVWLAGGDCKTNEYVQYLNTLRADNTNIRERWDNKYQSLNVCNSAIYYIKECEELSDANKIMLEAEVRAIRAHFLFMITETWGDVYLSTTPTKEVEMKVYRSPKEEFYATIIEDLEFAIANCRTGKSSDGRITRNGARAYLTRVLLTRASASYIQNNNRNADYQRVVSLANEIINSGEYSLWTNFKEAWSMEKGAEGSANSEVIWYVDFVNDNQLAWGGHQGLTTWVTKYDTQAGMMRDILYGRPYQRFMPTVFLLNLYDTKRDQRYAGTFRDTWLANLEPWRAQADFPRMNFGDTAVYLYNGIATAEMRANAAGRYRLNDLSDMYDSNGIPRGARSNTPYIQMNKYQDDWKLEMNQTWSSRDAIVVRLGDIYLMAAEAELALGNRSNALNFINTLRRQRAIDGFQDEMEITDGQLNIDFILDERARELAAEHFRWFDLKRTGKLLEKVRLHNPEARDNIEEKHLTRPIPQTFLDAIENKDEFGQNPGW